MWALPEVGSVTIELSLVSEKGLSIGEEITAVKRHQYSDG
jgi:hypothetical protein